MSVLLRKLMHRNLRVLCSGMPKGSSSVQFRITSATFNESPFRTSSSAFAFLSQYARNNRQLDICSIWCSSIRYYAKKTRDSGKKDGVNVSAKKGRIAEKPTVQLSSEELNEVIQFDKMKQQMDMALDHLRKDYVEQLALRTSSTMFDTLAVDTVDGQFSLIEIAQVVQKNPQLMLINMTATPQYITQVKAAIVNSGMNVNIQQDGTSLFVPIPRVTREHREGLAKNAKILCDKTKEKLRNIQNNFTRELKKSKDAHSQDLIHNLNETILTTTKAFMDKSEDILKAKQKELLDS